MGIVFIIFLIVLAVIVLYVLFKFLKWILIKKIRIVGSLSLFLIAIVGITIYQLFFVKMEFIQSNVYPDLYLIKNLVKDKSIVDQAIREKVMQEMTYTLGEKKLITVRFYEYNKGDWGERGTAYFIDHKEKRDGMLPELLEYYPECLLAKFSLRPCKNEERNYFGVLEFYTNGRSTKTDTLTNTCIK